MPDERKVGAQREAMLLIQLEKTSCFQFLPVPSGSVEGATGVSARESVDRWGSLSSGAGLRDQSISLQEESD